ncbi:MAG: hypothetical protein A2020_03985 [Lentisphaerae bacterium GWF2_45_14]|nr:MAG: hypothetical protein A2020_03985 [Lentisphaerae bacterium GWF2_45_14]
MDIIKKLEILSEDSQYDLACACGTSKGGQRKKSSDGKWLYPVPLPRGGYSILLKTLLSNACSNDCKYCPLRSDSNIRRCTIKPEETASLFMDYYRKNAIHGVFLSSGVHDTPERTMQLITDTAALIRRNPQARKAFIHLKVIPGCSEAAVEMALKYSNAVSLNIETPGEKHFRGLSSRKDYESDIIRLLKFISRNTGPGTAHPKTKCSTQFIVGASDETDSEIINYTFGIYERLKFKRVYFSAYQQGLGSPDIAGELKFSLSSSEDRLTREHRLYQADFLIRKYAFAKEDMIFSPGGNFSLEKDPKLIWAENHHAFYPVNINTASEENLLRVPGIGPETTLRILKLRKIHWLSNLSEIGLKGKHSVKTAPWIKFN